MPEQRTIVELRDPPGHTSMAGASVGKVVDAWESSGWRVYRTQEREGLCHVRRWIAVRPESPT